jgi:cellulose synthase/poly-beta-1,6-N-acetylglucosamine synthase-like glycosyltransferase
LDRWILSISLTVGICAHNESMNIGRLLNNILTEQELPAESEVLVVCSGCTDNTVAIVQDFARQDSRVRAYVENERKGKASAVNRILSDARGKVVLFISADTLPNKKCFNRLLSKLQLPNVGIVCGNPVPVNSSASLVGRLVHLLWSFHDHVFKQLNDAGLARHATEIYCIRKGIVDTIPSEAVNDDAYIALETKKRGWLIKYETQSRVLICGPKTINEYFQQRRRVIYGHYQVRKLTGESPQHLMYLIPVLPVRAIKLSLWLAKTQDIPTSMVFVLTEMTANLAAIVDILLKKKHAQWCIIESTKRLIPDAMVQPRF